MSIYLKMKKDLFSAMKAKNPNKVSILQFAIGELMRGGEKVENMSDSSIQKVILKILKDLKKTEGLATQEELEVLQEYCPPELSEGNIKELAIKHKGGEVKTFMSELNKLAKSKGVTVDNGLAIKIFKSM